MRCTVVGPLTLTFSTYNKPHHYKYFEFYKYFCFVIDLISKDGEKKDVAIRTIKPLLLKSSLKDLSEICLDVVKMLLHCDILDDVEHLRMDSLIVVTTKCPYKVTTIH